MTEINSPESQEITFRLNKDHASHELTEIMDSDKLPEKITHEDRLGGSWGRKMLLEQAPSLAVAPQPGTIFFQLATHEFDPKQGFISPDELHVYVTSELTDDGHYFIDRSKSCRERTDSWEKMVGHIMVQNSRYYFAKKARQVPESGIFRNRKATQFADQHDKYLNPHTYWSVVEPKVSEIKEKLPAKKHAHGFGDEISYIWRDRQGTPMAIVQYEKIRALDLNWEEKGAVNSYHTNLSDDVLEFDIDNPINLKGKFPELPKLRTDKEKVTFFKKIWDEHGDSVFDRYLAHREQNKNG